MQTVVAELVKRALLLPPEERPEILEAIWQQESLPETFIADEMAAITLRFENVRKGVFPLISSEKTQRIVRNSLRHQA